jgi:hypothetical protein
LPPTNLIANYPFQSCQTNSQCSCTLPWGQVVSIGATGWAYNTQQVDCGYVCQDPNFGRPYRCDALGAGTILWDTYASIPLEGAFNKASCTSKTDCAGQGGGEFGGDGDGQGLGSYGDASAPGGGGPGGPGPVCLPSDVPPGDYKENLIVQYSKARCKLPSSFSVPHPGIPEIFNIGGTIAPGVRLSAFKKKRVCPGEGTCEQRRISLYCDYDGRLYSPQLSTGEQIFPKCEVIKPDHPQFEELCP